MCKGFGRNILGIFIVWIEKSGLQSICLGLMRLEYVIILAKSQFVGLNWKKVKNCKNDKVGGKDEVTEETIKSGGKLDLV